MQTYRIHRLKEHLRNQVRFAPHVSGTATVKPRDYQPAVTGEDLVEAETPYAAFFALRDTRGAPGSRRSPGIRRGRVPAHLQVRGVRRSAMGSARAEAGRGRPARR